MTSTSFLIDAAELQRRLGAIKPLSYICNRNFLDGDVTRLSPFITHGILSVHDLARQALQDHEPRAIEKFLFQLAWREFFHRVWEARGDDIFSDLRQAQPHARYDRLPTAIDKATTGIHTLDQSIAELIDTGWIHNHARMWIAATVCNIGQTLWQAGARFMHYHLLDGDLASNSLSWQWVAGSFSNKTYVANQENLNKYSRSSQRGTFLDMDYPILATCDVPEVLEERTSPNLDNQFPTATDIPSLNDGDTLLLYHPHNLDPRWRQDTAGRRVLLIEPERFAKWPLGPARWQFISHWAKQINELSIHVGSLADLLGQATNVRVISREYPLYADWPGERDPRDWLFPEVRGYYPSFFKFWNKARKTF